MLSEAAVTTPSTSSKLSRTKAKRCEFCPGSKDRKLKSACSTSKKDACSDHSKMTVTCTKCKNAYVSGESE